VSSKLAVVCRVAVDGECEVQESHALMLKTVRGQQAFSLTKELA